MPPNSRLRIIETNYGRECGWYVEVNARRMAILVEPRWEDTFWVSYRVELLTEDPDERASLDRAVFGHSGVVYRNREFDAVAPFAFAGGAPDDRLVEPGRLWMRGLYLGVPSYPWDWLLLWFRRTRKASRGRTAEPDGTTSDAAGS